MRPAPGRTRFAAAPPPGGAVVCGLLAMLLLAACAGGADPDAAPGRAAAPTSVPIGGVQGRGDRSPVLGRQVVVEGVVTANLARGLGGFFLQDDGDGDAATADGLFVLAPPEAAPVRRGDRVRVRGIVVESGPPRASLTSIEPERVEPLGPGTLPAARVLSAPPADWEALEGMRLAVDAALLVTGNDQLARFGELELVFGGRLWQPTERHAPGPQAEALAADNARRGLLVDDGRNRQYAERVWYLPRMPHAGEPLRAGSRVAGVAGVLDQRHGRHRLQLDDPIRIIDQAPRPPPPALTDGLRVAAFNLLNFFNGDGAGGGFPTDRGAADPAAQAVQRQRLAATLAALDADIVALLELENDGDGPDSAIAELAEALAAASGRPHAFRVAANGGSDAIRVGLLYRPDRVEPLGPARSRVDGPFAHGSRAPLLQAFRAPGLAPFAVAVNHFKSKGGCDEAEGADRDRGDGQGCFNAARAAAARALAAWIGEHHGGIGPERTMIVGDLNAYGEEDPIRVLRDAGYRDAFAGLPPESRLSYVFQGRAGRLDHALLGAGLAAELRAAAFWAINADESDLFDYRLAGDPGPQARAYRSSDHDPLLLVLGR